MSNDKDNIQQILTSDLRQAVGFIKQAIQRSQARALRSVNNEVLSLYYGVGRYVSENSRHDMWGKGAMKTSCPRKFVSRIFYIHQCATRAWSKYALRDFIAQGLYKDRGNLPSNFTVVRPLRGPQGPKVRLVSNVEPHQPISA